MDILAFSATSLPQNRLRMNAKAQSVAIPQQLTRKCSNLVA
jgi:hypothetical protein